MSTIDSTYAPTVVRDRSHELLGQVMGLVAATVGVTAVGAYLGRDLSGGTGLVLFIAAFAAIFGLNAAAARGREQLLFCALLGLIAFGIVASFAAIPGEHIIYAVAVIVIFGAYTIFDFNRLRRGTQDAAAPIAAGIFLDVFNVFLFALDLFGGER